MHKATGLYSKVLLWFVVLLKIIRRALFIRLSGIIWRLFGSLLARLCARDRQGLVLFAPPIFQKGKGQKNRSPNWPDRKAAARLSQGNKGLALLSGGASQTDFWQIFAIFIYFYFSNESTRSTSMGTADAFFNRFILQEKGGDAACKFDNKHNGYFKHHRCDDGNNDRNNDRGHNRLHYRNSCNNWCEQVCGDKKCRGKLFGAGRFLCV